MGDWILVKVFRAAAPALLNIFRIFDWHFWPGEKKNLIIAYSETIKEEDTNTLGLRDRVPYMWGVHLFGTAVQCTCIKFSVFSRQTFLDTFYPICSSCYTLITYFLLVAVHFLLNEIYQMRTDWVLYKLAALLGNPNMKREHCCFASRRAPYALYKEGRQKRGSVPSQSPEQQHQ
jgi:hypothetical protein